MRSCCTGSPGFEATSFFILLHFQFVTPLLNALPHIANRVSRFTHSAFKISSNYSILVTDILALSRVFFLNSLLMAKTQSIPQNSCNYRHTHTKSLDLSGETAFEVELLRNYTGSCNRHSFSANSLCQALYKGTLRK